jgi:hypothetical protein
MPNAWEHELEAFRFGVKKLFKSRPFWLVTETDVRSRFIDAVLKGRKSVQVHDVCTEVTLGDVKKIDLVVKHPRRRTLAIEFKRWQVVAKPTHDLEGTQKSRSNEGALKGQWTSICKDVLKLQELLKVKPELGCLIVVYTQHRLADNHALDYGGRTPSDAFRLSLHDKIRSAELFQKALADKNPKIEIGIDDWTPRPRAIFRCAAGTGFSLHVFRLRSHHGVR